jgi:3-phenylpropionate/cinnamic acid dioxygenase small subunit
MGKIDDRTLLAFLVMEARLMDEHAYDEWLALWDPTEASYWIPCNDDDADPASHVSIANDDYPRLRQRVERLKTGAAWAQDPPSRMRRLVSNLEIEAQDGDVVDVSSNFILVELRRGKQDVFAGRTKHRIRVGHEGFTILSKKIVLLNNDEPLDNVAFLL